MSQKRADNSNPLVGVIMGSKSDWETMRHADEMLTLYELARALAAIK